MVIVPAATRALARRHASMSTNVGRCAPRLGCAPTRPEAFRATARHPIACAPLPAWRARAVRKSPLRDVRQAPAWSPRVHRVMRPVDRHASTSTSAQRKTAAVMGTQPARTHRARAHVLAIHRPTVTASTVRAATLRPSTTSRHRTPPPKQASEWQP